MRTVKVAESAAAAAPANTKLAKATPFIID
jgi:hypothetical protein